MMNERLAPGETFTVVVVGKPAPAGSKTGRRTEKGWAMRPASKRTKPWMRKAAAVMSSEWGDYEPLDCAVEVRCRFVYERPKAHYRADGTLKPSAPPLPATTGDDLDKLLRATLDALQGKGLPTDLVRPMPFPLREDRRVVRLGRVERVYGSPERAEIELERIDEDALRLEADGQAPLPLAS